MIPRDPGREPPWWYRPTIVGITVLILIAAVEIGLARFAAFESRGLVGIDLKLFNELGRRWADTGTQYAQFQLSGPYAYDAGSGGTDVSVMPGLYPPLAGPLFAVIRVFPAFVWWAPVILLPVLLVSWRPRPWTWPLMAICLCWPGVSSAVIAGNTSMWTATLFGAGLMLGWPAALLLLKPSLAPLAIAGARRRSWFLVIGIITLGTVAMFAEAERYLTILRNQRGGDLLYSIVDPLLAVPLLGWIARSRYLTQRAPWPPAFLRRDNRTRFD